MLYRGLQSSSPETVSKCSSMICLRRESLYRPHIREDYHTVTVLALPNPIFGEE
jgi:hypothetical protein